MNTTIQGILLPSDTFMFSMYGHDYNTRDGYMIDGGQPYNGYYTRAGYPPNTEVKYAWMMFPHHKTAFFMNNPDIRYIHIKDPEYNISEVPSVDTESIEYLINHTTWGKYVKGGKLEFINLWDAETDHLKNIIKTQPIDEKLKTTINAILERRTEK